MSIAWPAYHLIPGHSLPKIDALVGASNSEEVVFEEIPTGTILEQFEASVIQWDAILVYVYWLVVVIILIRCIDGLWCMIEMTKKVSFQKSGLYIVRTESAQSPFSFFKYLFIHPEMVLDEGVFLHEKAHSEQLHSLDLLIVECLKCFFWFNPFVYLLKRAIAENHEYLADREVSNQGIDQDEYVKSMVESVLKPNIYPLSSGFSYLLTQNRINMLQNHKSSKNKTISKVIIAILCFSLVIIVCSFSFRSEPKPMHVLIDAGHGGKDSGASYHEVLEKDLVYRIAENLRKQSVSTHIKISLLRRGDQFVSLKERIKQINQINPDLLLSLHTNWSSAHTDHGVEAYISQNSKQFDLAPVYARQIIKEQLIVGFEKAEIKQSNNLKVLRDSKCPAILLELGFLSNEKDRDILLSAKSQKELSDQLFSSLLNISLL